MLFFLFFLRICAGQLEIPFFDLLFLRDFLSLLILERAQNFLLLGTTAGSEMITVQP